MEQLDAAPTILKAATDAFNALQSALKFLFIEKAQRLQSDLDQMANPQKWSSMSDDIDKVCAAISVDLSLLALAPSLEREEKPEVTGFIQHLEHAKRVTPLMVHMKNETEKVKTSQRQMLTTVVAAAITSLIGAVALLAVGRDFKSPY